MHARSHADTLKVHERPPPLEWHESAPPKTTPSAPPNFPHRCGASGGVPAGAITPGPTATNWGS
eukprot:11244210-Alexandrium_andersonii.AAC.1